MKCTKKILAVMLTLCMLLPLIQVGSFAASYTITFDADGGELVGPATYDVNVGDFYVDIFGEEAPKATMEGYNLVGWFCEKWNYWLDMDPTSYFAVNEDITFVAIWEEAPVEPDEPIVPDEPVEKDWTMYFDPDGGEMVGPTEYGINTGDFYEDIFGETIPQAVLEGYKLIGWYLEKYNFTLTDGDVVGGGYYAVAEDSYFVALWEEAPVEPDEPIVPDEPVEKDWTMYFDPDGGEMVGPTEYGINVGDFYADIFGETIPQATLDGYVLIGWYLEKWNFTLTDGDVTGGGYYAVAEDSYFVALWEEAPEEPVVPDIPDPQPIPDPEKPADKSWVLTFDPDGGILDEGFEYHYYFNTGDEYKDIMPGYPTATLEGYNLIGWYLEAWNYTFTQGDYETGYYALTEDAYMVALWEVAPIVPDEPDVPTEKDYTMYFDPDGGEMVGPTEYGVNVGDFYADIFGETIPQATLDGYVLIGWYLEKWNFTLTDGDVTGGGYYAVAEDSYFVALWEEAPEEPVVPDIPDPEPLPDPDKPADKSWILTLDPDGGKMDEGFENYYYFNTGDEYKDIMPAYPTASLEGYNFIGWYLEAWNYTFTEGDYNSGYYALTEDAYMVALWEVAPIVPDEPTDKDYTMYFDPDGGEMVGPTEYGVNMGDMYADIFGETIPQATLDGYVLIGWYAEKWNFTLTDGDVTGGGYYAVAEDCYFVALWEEAPEEPVVPDIPDPEPLPDPDKPADKSWILTLDPDGGKMDEGFENYYYFNTGDEYKDIMPAYPTASLEGYNFIGWYLEAWNYTFTEGDYNSGYYALTEDAYMVALWEVAPIVPDEPTDKEWTMYFDPDGGEMVGPTEYGVNVGDFYADIFGETIPQATLDGYVLIGWYLEKWNFTLTDGDVTGGGYYAVAEDSYFVALWEEAPEEPVVPDIPDPEPLPDPDKPADKAWILTLDPDGGKMDEGFENYYYFNTGDEYKDIMPAYPTASLEGYNFIGWYLEAWNYTFTEGDYNSGYYALTEDAYMVALWEVAPIVPDEPTEKDYTMYFDPDGGEMAEGWATEYGVNVGDFYADIFGETIPQATLDGYVLIGWYLEKWNFTLTDGDVTGGGYYAVAEDSYFVALWEEAPEEPVVPDIPDPQPIPDPEKPDDKSWVLTFDPDGGILDEGFEYHYYFNTGDEYKDIMPGYPTATLEGYNLIGWYLEAWNYTFTQGDYETGYYALTEDAYMVALWEVAPVEPEPDVPAEKEWKMYFDPDGGEMAEGWATEYGVNVGDMYADIFGETIPQATLEGYVLIGWYLEKWNFTLTDGDVTGGGYYAVAEDSYFVALWEEDPNYVPPTECEHEWSEWVVTVEPQVGVPGEETRTCALCGAIETQEVPALEAPAKAWTITFDPDGGVMGEGFETSYGINTGDYYKDILPGYPTAILEGYILDCWYLEKYNFFFTVGDYESGYYAVSEDCVLVAQWAEDPNYVPPTETEITVTSSEGTITVSGLVDINDLWIAEGEWTTYADIKAQAASYFRVKGDSTRIVDGVLNYKAPTDGLFTVIVRLTDGTELVFNVEVATYFVLKGASITVNHIDVDTINDVWVSAGTLDNYADIKANMIFRTKADGKRVIDGSFTYNFTKGGYYTVAIRTLDGELKIQHVTIDTGLDVDVAVNGKVVTVSGLDRDTITVIRYAKGEYTTGGAIKNATGVQFVRGRELVESELSVELASGTYTFMIQYTNGIQLFNTVVVA